MLAFAVVPGVVVVVMRGLFDNHSVDQFVAKRRL
jgi:hypothetical protein